MHLISLYAFIAIYCNESYLVVLFACIPLPQQCPIFLAHGEVEVVSCLQVESNLGQTVGSHRIGRNNRAPTVFVDFEESVPTRSSNIPAVYVRHRQVAGHLRKVLLDFLGLAEVAEVAEDEEREESQPEDGHAVVGDEIYMN